MNQHRIELSGGWLLLLNEVDPTTFMVVDLSLGSPISSRLRVVPRDGIMGFSMHHIDTCRQWIHKQWADPRILTEPFPMVYRDVKLGYVHLQPSLFRAPNLEQLRNALEDVDIVIGVVTSLPKKS